MGEMVIEGDQDARVGLLAGDGVIGGVVVRIHADDVELRQIGEGGRGQIFKLAAENQVEKLFGLARCSAHLSVSQ